MLLCPLVERRKKTTSTKPNPSDRPLPYIALYQSYREHLSLLSFEQTGRVIMALYAHAAGEEPPTLDGASAMCYSFMRAGYDRDRASYVEKCRQNRANAAKAHCKRPKPPPAAENALPDAPPDDPSPVSDADRPDGRISPQTTPEPPAAGPPIFLDSSSHYQDTDSAIMKAKATHRRPSLPTATDGIPSHAKEKKKEKEKEKKNTKEKNSPPPVPPEGEVPGGWTQAPDYDREVGDRDGQTVSYAEFVRLTEKEHAALVARYGEADTALLIQILDNYKGASGRTYRSDYRAILSWVVKRLPEERAVQKEGASAAGYDWSMAEEILRYQNEHPDAF